MPRRRPEPVWVDRLVLDAVHLDQLREHGGMPGVREEHTLEAALARPKQRWHYEPTSDLATLAAACGWGLATSHPYHDGNKRIAFLATVIFLGLNGADLDATEADVVTTMLAVADNRLTEAQLADWIRVHQTKLSE